MKGGESGGKTCFVLFAVVGLIIFHSANRNKQVARRELNLSYLSGIKILCIVKILACIHKASSNTLESLSRQQHNLLLEL